MKVPEHLLKINIPWKVSTEPVAGENREENTLRFQFLRINSLTSSRTNMYIALIEKIQNPIVHNTWFLALI